MNLLTGLVMECISGRIILKGPGCVLRYLDCAVVEYTHSFLKFKNQPAFDSVRAAFIEGDKIYPGAGFNEKTHIQICILNPNCIKGFFKPRIGIPAS